jgi:hypothetical protein
MGKHTPLSKTQAELLAALRAGVGVHYMPYAGRFNPRAYYFRADTYKRCTAAADALIRRGLAKLEGGWNNKKLAPIDSTKEAA